MNITERFQIERLINALLSLRKTDQEALRKQIIQLDAEIQSCEQEIAELEAGLNAIVYRLYKLNPEEIKLMGRK